MVTRDSRSLEILSGAKISIGKGNLNNPSLEDINRYRQKHGMTELSEKIKVEETKMAEEKFIMEEHASSEWLIKQYVEKDRSAGSIAKELNIPTQKVRSWFYNHNVKKPVGEKVEVKKDKTEIGGALEMYDNAIAQLESELKKLKDARSAIIILDKLRNA